MWGQPPSAVREAQLRFVGVSAILGQVSQGELPRTAEGGCPQIKIGNILMELLRQSSAYGPVGQPLPWGR